MNKGSTSLPNDPGKLKEMVVEQRELLTLKQAKIDHQSHYIDQLVEAIALAGHQYFGSRGQMIDTESTQLSWLFNEAEVIADHDADASDQDNNNPGAGKKETSPRKRRTGGRKPPSR